jgi:hypothetical protein
MTNIIILRRDVSSQAVEYWQMNVRLGRIWKEVVVVWSRFRVFAFAQRNCVKLRKTSVRRADVLPDMRISSEYKSGTWPLSQVTWPYNCKFICLFIKTLRHITAILYALPNALTKVNEECGRNQKLNTWLRKGGHLVDLVLYWGWHWNRSLKCYIRAWTEHHWLRIGFSGCPL